MKNLSRIKTVRHGMYGTRPYSIWSGMKRRCYNKNEVSYKRYGGAGILMCGEWRDSFLNFWEDMKDTYFDEAQIDRIDNNEGYYTGNCRWVTLKEQQSNKRNVVFYEFNGKKMHSSDWDRELGLHIGSVRARLRYGWSIEKALSTPVKQTKGYFRDRGLYKVEVKYKNKRYFVGRFKTKKEAIKQRKNFLYQLICKNNE